VLALLGGDKDRGAFLSNLQIINSLVGIATYLAVALALAGTPLPYGIPFSWAGHRHGVAGSLLLFRLPSPTNTARPNLHPSGRSPGAVKSKPVRDYFLVFTIISFAAGTVRPSWWCTPRAVYGSGTTT
jgi:hypothetical protein